MSKIKEKMPFKAAVPLLVGFGTILLLLGGFTYWAARAQIDGAVVASGRMVVERNRHAVQHLTGGVVKEILVKEGDTVQENDLLVRLDPTLALSELKIVDGQLYELMARRGRLEAERDEMETIAFDPRLIERAIHDLDVEALMKGQQNLFEARAESLKGAITQLNNQQQQLVEQIHGINAQMTATDRQLTLVGTETVSQQTLLDKGLAQSSRVLALQREDARLAGAMGDLTSRRAQAMERKSELAIQELQYRANRREEAISVLRDLQYNELEMAERSRALQTQLDQMEIRAPISGVVYDLKVYGRLSVIRPAEALLFLVPQDRALVIEAQIEPLNVTDVHVAQDVILRFSAFDMRETPDLFGKVTHISPDAFTDAQTGRPFYRVEINLPKEELSKLTADQTLIPGMPVDAFIRTGEHSPLTYLTSPLTRYFGKAMRDNS
ncbi:HlyD family type I secretion periplasmic adaptor subunit [Sulfitobacter sp.]|uniref:HlyD family type I secretion periplasmic adaptor subunit n=1 Tax=Sulfitobacter sp. TaxID=1903071 RepID=UPI003002823A